MALKNDTKKSILILLLCILWYIVSSTNNVVGKMVLNDFPFPMTLTMVQFVTITVWSGPVFNLWGIRKHNTFSWRYYCRFIIPLAFGKFIASVFSHVSIWKVPVSYAHTVKATIPLHTVILSRIILGERQSNKVYLSLVPIVVGVCIATLTEISFDTIGLISALVATMVFSLQNIFSKKVIHDTGVHHLRLLHILGRLALFMFLPVWFCVDFLRLFREDTLNKVEVKVLVLLFTDGFLNWLQNIIAFSLLSLVTPLTYSVANSSKRIFVIGVSLFVLGNPVSATNIFGMLLAIFGVLLYNKAKYDQRLQEKKETVLPYSSNLQQKKNQLFWHIDNGINNGFRPFVPSNAKEIYTTNNNVFKYNSQKLFF